MDLEKIWNSSSRVRTLSSLASAGFVSDQSIAARVEADGPLRHSWGVRVNEQDLVVEDLCGRGPLTWCQRSLASFLLFLFLRFRLRGKLVAAVENGFGEDLEEFFAGEDAFVFGISWLRL